MLSELEMGKTCYSGKEKLWERPKIDFHTSSLEPDASDCSPEVGR